MTGGEIEIAEIAGVPNLTLDVKRVSLLKDGAAEPLRGEWVEKLPARVGETDSATADGAMSMGSTRDGRQQTFLPFKDKLYYRDPERWAEQYGAEIEQWKNAYWLCHRLLDSKAEVYYGNVYDLPRELGQFDIAIVGSVLEHLSDQITALASIARLTKETIVLVSPLLQTDERIARFEALAGNPDADFTWWTYSLGVYREVFAMLGFTIARVSHSKYYYMYGDRFEERSTIVAVRD